MTLEITFFNGLINRPQPTSIFRMKVWILVQKKLIVKKE
jgi:hypothetical protein